MRPVLDQCPSCGWGGAIGEGPQHPSGICAEHAFWGVTWVKVIQKTFLSETEVKSEVVATVPVLYQHELESTVVMLQGIFDPRLFGEQFEVVVTEPDQRRF